NVRVSAGSSKFTRSRSTIPPSVSSVAGQRRSPRVAKDGLQGPPADLPTSRSVRSRTGRWRGHKFASLECGGRGLEDGVRRNASGCCLLRTVGRLSQKGHVMASKEKAAWRDPALGTARELELPQGRLRYFESGAGSPVVFAHGLLVNANLWRKV